MAGGDRRIVNITLDEPHVVRRSADIEHERATAIFDLLEENTFALGGDAVGPFHLHLAMEGPRLVLDIRTAEEGPVERIALGLAELRPIIKDYFLICESYNHAIRSASLSKITAIDQGRRALHDEAAELLRERLAPQVTMDFDTSRRLFTLLCVLQIRG